MTLKARIAMWTHQRRFVTPSVLLLALLFAGAAGAVRFTDATGDAGVAPDMTSLDVTNDARARITLRLSLANRSAALEPTDLIDVLVDSDRSTATGTVDGIDYLLELTQAGIGVRRWDRAQARYVDVAAASASASMTGGVMTVVVPRAVLGKTAAFDAILLSARVVGRSVEGLDRAPDSGELTYTLTRFCVVPKLTGKTLAAARSLLTKADCRVGKVRRRRSTAKIGRVVGQSPRAGTTRPRGARVNLVVSRGRR